MRTAGKVAIGIAVVLVAIQLVRFERTNPPVTSEIQAPPEVQAVLRRSCYDCHSNETRWPWYTHVAPVSWLLHYDVVEGRRELNFSEWGQIPDAKRARKQKESGKEVREGEMPPWYYLPMHTDARLSPADEALVEQWANGPVSPVAGPPRPGEGAAP